VADAALEEAHVPAPERERIGRMILATAHRSTADAEGDAALVMDADLSVLGADAAIFDAYERAIREEYAFVPEVEFARRRREILSSFLARPSIYSTRFFRDRCEARARANLTRSIQRLRTPER
jgi:predicted metal-dependent HD superfamily phosphohydrolase